MSETVCCKITIKQQMCKPAKLKDGFRKCVFLLSAWFSLQPSDLTGFYTFQHMFETVCCKITIKQQMCKPAKLKDGFRKCVFLLSARFSLQPSDLSGFYTFQHLFDTLWRIQIFTCNTVFFSRNLATSPQCNRCAMDLFYS